jgi:5-methylcytosine-specific restriction enzyme subunit McrC
VSNKNLIQVFEHHKLRVGEKSFNQQHFKSMVLFNEQHNNKYFTVGYNSVKFTSYVGVLQVGGLTIEVLPKADNNSKADESTWQGVLLNMLKVCKHLKVDNISEAQLAKRYNSILEVYYDMFLTEVEALIHKGLIKKYRRKQTNQTALKGKLLFAQNIQKNVVHKERFYCEHQVYDKNHIYHQILKEALSILSLLVGTSLEDKVKRSSFAFDSVKSLKITAKHFETLTINRHSAPYSNALDIAKMIILNYSPSLSSGSDNMLTLLFNMNQLWEDYIYRILYKHTDDSFEVLPQQREEFWEAKIIKPDIVLKKDKKTYIIDTKWKVVNNNEPSDADLKQMFAYNLLWKAEKSLLLYPKIDQTDSAFGKYQYVDYEKTSNVCKLGFVSIVEDDKMIDSSLIAKAITDKLEF